MTPSHRSEAFMELITLHQQQIFGYLYALLHDMNDTEDVFQQTSLVLWKKFDQYRTDSSFLHWANRVAQFEAMNFLKSKRRRRLRFSDELLTELATLPARTAADTSDTVERQAALSACLEKLGDSDRRLIEECYQTDQPIKQIASEMDRSPQSVSNSLRRIRLALMKCISGRLDQEGPR